MKTSLMCAITLDGKIARNDHEFVNWSSKEDKRLFISTTRRIGVMILGQSTFNTFESPLPGRLHIVVTRDTTGKKNIPGQVEYTSDPPEKILSDLEARGYEEAVVTGGSQINALFLKANLIDELYLTLEPVVFGDGISLFDSGDFNARWRLTHLEKLNDTGSIFLNYVRA